MPIDIAQIKQDLSLIAGATLGSAKAYITFDYTMAGVNIPDNIRGSYRARGIEFLTLVFENWYRDLKDHGDYFSVILLFNKQHYTVTIPYRSILVWNCESVGTQPVSYRSEEFYDLRDKLIRSLAGEEPKDLVRRTLPAEDPPFDSNDNVVSLDSFRKKR